MGAPQFSLLQAMQVSALGSRQMARAGAGPGLSHRRVSWGRLGLVCLLWAGGGESRAWPGWVLSADHRPRGGLTSHCATGQAVPMGVGAEPALEGLLEGSAWLLHIPQSVQPCP